MGYPQRQLRPARRPGSSPGRLDRRWNIRRDPHQVGRKRVELRSEGHHQRRRLSVTMYDGNDPGTRNYLLTPELPFVGWARPGETVSFRTLDSSGNQIAEGVDYDALDHQRFFPV